MDTINSLIDKIPFTLEDLAGKKRKITHITDNKATRGFTTPAQQRKKQLAAEKVRDKLAAKQGRVKDIEAKYLHNKKENDKIMKDLVERLKKHFSMDSINHIIQNSIPQIREILKKVENI